MENNGLVEARIALHNEKKAENNLRTVYNLGAVTLLMQYIIVSTISGIISFLYAFYVTIQAIIVNPDIWQKNFLSTVLTTSFNPLFLIIVNAGAMLIANLSSYFMGQAMLGKRYDAKLFGKIQMKFTDCILAVLSIIGIQMVSVFIQSVIMTVTGLSGVSEETSEMMSISDDPLKNAVLILYTVFIAAITEELLFRGVLLKALSVKSKGFALVASSLLFGIMHGNFNQMINGFLLGMVIGYAAIKGKSIILPIILHITANAHAMLISFVGYKFGDDIVIIQGLYIILIALVGVLALTILFIRLGLPNDKTDGYPVTKALEGVEMIERKKGFTWNIILKSPVFWIFIVIYFISALLSITVMG